MRLCQTHLLSQLGGRKRQVTAAFCSIANSNPDQCEHRESKDLMKLHNSRIGSFPSMSGRRQQHRGLHCRYKQTRNMKTGISLKRQHHKYSRTCPDDHLIRRENRINMKQRAVNMTDELSSSALEGKWGIFCFSGRRRQPQSGKILLRQRRESR